MAYSLDGWGLPNYARVDGVGKKEEVRVMIPKTLKDSIVWELQPGQESVPCLWDYLQASNLDTLTMGAIPRHWGQEPKPGDVKCLYKAN